MIRLAPKADGLRGASLDVGGGDAKPTTKAGDVNLKRDDDDDDGRARRRKELARILRRALELLEEEK